MRVAFQLVVIPFFKKVLDPRFNFFFVISSLGASRVDVAFFSDAKYVWYVFDRQLGYQALAQVVLEAT